MNKPHMLAKQNELIQQMLNSKEPNQSQMISDTSSIVGKRLNTETSSLTQNSFSKAKKQDDQEPSQDASQNIIPPKKKRTVASSTTKTKQPPQSQYSDLFTFKMPDAYYKELKPTAPKP